MTICRVGYDFAYMQGIPQSLANTQIVFTNVNNKGVTMCHIPIAKKISQAKGYA